MPVINTTISPTPTPMLNGTHSTGGAGENWEFTVGGTWLPGDKITIVLTDTLTGLVTQIGAGYVTGVVPTFVFTFNNKVYALSGSTAYCSAVSDPTTWNSPTGVGNGFVTMSDFWAVNEDLVAISPYQGKLVFFSRYTSQIWIVDPLLVNWQQFQVIPNYGTFAPLSVQSLGDLDTLFLTDTGVRSIRSLQYSLYAFPTDIGAPIDSLVQASLLANTAITNEAACGVADPGTGRYWLFLNGTIYVLSYYPANKIEAWGTYLPSVDLPTPPVLTAMAASTSQINLAWTAATADTAVTYNLYRSTLSGFSPFGATPIATGLTGLTYSDTGLASSTEYYYYVIAFNAIGNPAVSNEANATTQGSGSQPGSFVLTSTWVSFTANNLSWTTPSGSGITYNVYRGTSAGFTPGAGNIISTGQSGTTYSDTGLTPNTPVWYYVKAINGSGSSFSNEANSSIQLLAWYKADTGVYHDAGTTLATNGQTVQQWNDQSGNGFNASATPTELPIYNTSGLNSLPTLSNGIVSSNVTNIVAPCVMFMVINYLATALEPVSVDGFTLTLGDLNYIDYVTPEVVRGGSTTRSTWHVVTIVCNGASTSIRVDGVVTASGAMSAALFLNGALYFGLGGTDGSVTYPEFIFALGVLTTTQIQEVEAYLNTKYGI